MLLPPWLITYSFTLRELRWKRGFLLHANANGRKNDLQKRIYWGSIGKCALINSLPCVPGGDSNQGRTHHEAMLASFPSQILRHWARRPCQSPTAIQDNVWHSRCFLYSVPPSLGVPHTLPPAQSLLLMILQMKKEIVSDVTKWPKALLVPVHF